jgi:transposase
MAYKMSNRMQQTFLPSTIDDYVSQQDPVRVYDAFVDALDFSKLGIPLEVYQAGADRYYPREMVKLLIYGYSYGFRSSRKLERAGKHNLSFMWLMGGLTPAYRTIARFRDTYKEQIKDILKQSVRLCIKLGLIDGNSLFIDSSVFKANAALNRTYDHKRCQKAIRRINEHIDELVDEIQRFDTHEQDKEPLTQLNEELADQKKRKQKIQEIVKELNQRQKHCTKEQTPFYNTTDSECSKIHKSNKTTAGYNVQASVDGKQGLIVHAESTNVCNDAGQLNDQIQKAKEVLDKTPETICSDTGYYSLDNLSKVDDTITVVIPNQKQVLKERKKDKPTPFDKERFIYDEESDHYTCPQGHRLNRVGFDKNKHRYSYRTKKRNCVSCLHFQECTDSPKGRTIKRSIHEKLKNQLEQIYESEQGQKIYAQRKQKAELPFGHLKHNLQAKEFLLKGKSGTNAEVSLMSTCFNITRMISLIGITQLLIKLPVL